MHVQYNQKTFNLLRINTLSKYIFQNNLAKAPARFQLMTYREVALLGKKFEKENMFKIILDFIGGGGLYALRHNMEVSHTTLKWNNFFFIYL